MLVVSRSPAVAVVCHTLVIEALLGAGADPFLENGAGRTAMDLAVKLSAAAASTTPWASRGGSNGLAVLRRLEREAAFVGHIKLHIRPATSRDHHSSVSRTLSCILTFVSTSSCPAQIHPFTSRDYYSMWVCLAARRFSQPFGAAPKDRSSQLLCYGSSSDARCQWRAEIDGCCLVREEECLRLLLFPGPPSAYSPVFMQPRSREAHSKWDVSLRPGSSGNDDVERFSAFMIVLNDCSVAGSRSNRRMTGGGGGSHAAAAAAAAAALP
ncbi:MAG: hypothetical protein WDW38_010919 [Sanguina aurantia]